jgi:glycosyltransferase involved in cell wall biosynthesis
MCKEPRIAGLVEQSGALLRTAYICVAHLIELPGSLRIALQRYHRECPAVGGRRSAAIALPGTREIERLLCIAPREFKAAVVAVVARERRIVQPRKVGSLRRTANGQKEDSEYGNPHFSAPFRSRRNRQWFFAKIRTLTTPPVSSSDNPAILQVIPGLDAGGAERTTIDVARALVRDGWRALVASEGGRMEPLLSSTGAELLPMPLNSKAPQKLFANARRLAKLIRTHNVKLIHARSRAPAWSALLATRRTGTPFVTTYHGIYNASNPFKRYYNSVMVRSDAVIANSQWTADHIAREHGIPCQRITVIHRGVDLEEFDPAGVSPDRIAALRARWNVDEGQMIVLLPGRLTRWKGQLVFLAALAQLARANALDNVKAVIAGDAQGRNDYIAELRAAIAQNGLESTVPIVPHIIDMPAAYLASDIVISASTDPEAFGRVAAEAGAMGRPVIASDHGGARETVLPNRSGLLIPPGNTEALGHALRALLSAPDEERRRMGEAGRAHVRANFSLERMCADTIAVYRRLLSLADDVW